MNKIWSLSTTLVIATLILTGCSTENPTTVIEPLPLPESSISIETEPKAETPEKTQTGQPGTSDTSEEATSSNNSSAAEESRETNVEKPESTTTTVEYSIQDFIAATTMEDSLSSLFINTDPEMVSGAVLKEKCGDANASEEANILGCFTTNPNRIYLYRISDSRMKRVENVIAAHEVLHAVWHLELDERERTEVGAELQAYYESLPADHFLRARVKLYASKPSSIPTELHSILGTEAASLPASLEKYYSRWFKDRSAIVSDADATFGYIRQLAKEIATAKEIIEVQRKSIEERRVVLNATNEQLTKDVNAFNEVVASGKIELQEYERQRQALADRRDDLNAELEIFNSDIEKFNAAIATNNKKTELFNELNLAISTSK